MKMPTDSQMGSLYTSHPRLPAAVSCFCSGPFLCWAIAPRRSGSDLPRAKPEEVGVSSSGLRRFTRDPAAYRQAQDLWRRHPGGEGEARLSTSRLMGSRTSSRSSP